MNWDAVGAISEGVGALAVVITLAYLATQVRYAKITASDSNRLNRANGVREMYFAQVQDPAIGLAHAAADPIMDAYYQTHAEAFGLTLEQTMRIDTHCNYYFWLHWGQFASSTTPADIRELRNLVRGYYAIPHVIFSWENGPYAKPLLDSQFVEFVEQVLAESSGTEPDSHR